MFVYLLLFFLYSISEMYNWHSSSKIIFGVQGENINDAIMHCWLNFHFFGNCPQKSLKKVANVAKGLSVVLLNFNALSFLDKNGMFLIML
ncbi:UNVERIFIED_CONTAM: hypothetical protein NCL1_43096 [Trichonephila clavipes]